MRHVKSERTMRHTLLISNTAQRRITRCDRLEHRTVLAEELKIGYTMSILCRGIDGTKLLDTMMSDCWREKVWKNAHGTIWIVRKLRY